MRKIGARLTYVQELTAEEAYRFYAENHRQRSNPQLSLKSLGLFDGEELVGAISFCAPRTAAKKREYSLELYRLCFKNGVRVPGGASKLIKEFIREYRPADFFTYQDMSGEGTSVYELAGMTQVGRPGKKKYLVAPGLTLDTAHWGEAEIFTVAEVSRRGPDALLGTTLGEVFDEDGQRVSNPRLFTEVLGWSEVEAPGDRVYEWVDLDRTYYTYRITASDSDKYYYGVSHLKKAGASVEDCLSDGYYGSGGAKYQNWREKHRACLKKEIMELFPRRMPAYEAERALIGDLYKDDPLCLNSTAGGGGLLATLKTPSIATIEICSVHGEANHVRGKCCRCSAIQTIFIKSCPNHGESLHRGESCFKCVSEKSFSTKSCPVHGEVTHHGEVCLSCISSEAWSHKVCSVHGKTKHISGVCSKCSAGKSLSIRSCPVHGETSHRGDSCAKCVAAESFTVKICPTHGEVIHHGDNCSSCISINRITIKECLKHGETKHWGETCVKCNTNKAIFLKECPVHGETKHRGESCSKCISDETISDKICPIHGETKHKGNTCLKCSAAKTLSIKQCPIHGEAQHSGDRCRKCISMNVDVIKHCNIHGETKHRGDSCCKCAAQKAISLKLCPTHGETKHRGSSCYRCMGERRKNKKALATSTPQRPA